MANELGLNESSIHLWRRERLKDGNLNAATSGEQEREMVELKKKLREAQMENEILSCSLRESSGGEAKAVPVHRRGKEKLPA